MILPHKTSNIKAINDIFALDKKESTSKLKTPSIVDTETTEAGSHMVIGFTRPDLGI